MTSLTKRFNIKFLSLIAASACVLLMPNLPVRMPSIPVKKAECHSPTCRRSRCLLTLAPPPALAP